MMIHSRELVCGHQSACTSPINLTIEPGRLTAIAGVNGAGKSTFLRTVAGFQPPLQGHIDIGGKRPHSMDLHSRSQLLTWLPQGARCDWPLTVQRTVLLGRHPGRSAVDRDAAERAMIRTDVQHLAQRRVDRLSGGELARVMLARALARETPILLADEPVAGLDPGHALYVLKELQSLASAGRTVVLVLHDLDRILKFCDDCLLLDRKASRFGPAGEVLTPDAIREAFGVQVDQIEHKNQKLLVNWRI